MSNKISGVCVVCDRETKLQCPCNSVFYCSKTCQVGDRHNHKLNCSKYKGPPPLISDVEKDNEKTSGVIDCQEVIKISEMANTDIDNFLSSGVCFRDTQARMDECLEKSYSWIKASVAKKIIFDYLKSGIIDRIMYDEHLAIIERVCPEADIPVINNGMSLSEINNLMQNSENTSKNLRRYGKDNGFFNPKLCEICKIASKHKCSQCLTTYYCSEKCQIDHWKAHKKSCNK
jgi:hypothetical protein